MAKKEKMTWYEDEVRQLEAKLPNNTNRVVFYGSSSVRLWTTLVQDFPGVDMLNLGFGGSTLAACAWFFDRLLLPAKPRSVLLYAGDNDLGDGRNPEEVFLFFYAFAQKMRLHLPDVPLTFLTIKISPTRWNLADPIRQTNRLIQEYINQMPNARSIDTTTSLLGVDGRPRREFFQNDGLHLTPAGYEAWRDTLQPHLPFF